MGLELYQIRRRSTRIVPVISVVSKLASANNYFRRNVSIVLMHFINLDVIHLANICKKQIHTAIERNTISSAVGTEAQLMGKG